VAQCYRSNMDFTAFGKLAEWAVIKNGSSLDGANSGLDPESKQRGDCFYGRQAEYKSAVAEESLGCSCFSFTLAD
jgi:hypothetical protein